MSFYCTASPVQCTASRLRCTASPLHCTKRPLKCTVSPVQCTASPASQFQGYFPSPKGISHLLLQKWCSISRVCFIRLYQVHQLRRHSHLAQKHPKHRHFCEHPPEIFLEHNYECAVREIRVQLSLVGATSSQICNEHDNHWKWHNGGVSNGFWHAHLWTLWWLLLLLFEHHSLVGSG